MAPSPRYQWIDDMREALIPSGPMHAAYALFHFMDAEASCFPSATTLARESGANERSIRDWLRWLAEHGMIELEPRPGRTPIIRGRPRAEGWALVELIPEAGAETTSATPEALSGVARKQVPDTPEAASDEPPTNPPGNHPSKNNPKGKGLTETTGPISGRDFAQLVGDVGCKRAAAAEREYLRRVRRDLARLREAEAA